jgi:hypothetical protein
VEIEIFCAILPPVVNYGIDTYDEGFVSRQHKFDLRLATNRGEQRTESRE